MGPRRLGKYRLYYQGTWDEKVFAKCMAVVGSRRMTGYGRRVVERIVPQLVNAGWTIVSGLMYGIDSAAHETCLECGGKTIGVLGWGINYAIGETERALQEKIVAAGGLLLSLWETQMGTNWTFPARNKVVADISQELIIVEAAVKSGALLTAAMMRNLGKKVWAVPGPIVSSVSAGTNGLIARGLAQPWLGDNFSVAPATADDPVQSAILALVRDEDKEPGEIARTLGQPIDKIVSQLSLLVLTGTVLEKDGKYHASQS